MCWRLIVLALLLAPSVAAQPADQSNPASFNLMNAAYPRVYPDGRIAVRLLAPNAAKVQLDGALSEKPLDMTKGAVAAPRYFRCLLLRCSGFLL